MVTESFSGPVENSVAKVNDEIAVGEDLDFQRRWWRFENAVWIFFTLLIVCDLIGLFGRGPIAETQREAGDGTIRLAYERIERTQSPSIMTVHFGPKAIHDGKVVLFVSSSLVKELGTQRIIPAPQTTVVGDGGLTYSFPATRVPASVDLALEPSGPGVFNFTVGVAGAQPISERVWVVP